MGCEVNTVHLPQSSLQHNVGIDREGTDRWTMFTDPCSLALSELLKSHQVNLQFSLSLSLTVYHFITCPKSKFVKEERVLAPCGPLSPNLDPGVVHYNASFKSYIT